MRPKKAGKTALLYPASQYDDLSLAEVRTRYSWPRISNAYPPSSSSRITREHISKQRALRIKGDKLDWATHQSNVAMRSRVADISQPTTKSYPESTIRLPNTKASMPNEDRATAAAADWSIQKRIPGGPLRRRQKGCVWAKGRREQEKDDSGECMRVEGEDGIQGPAVGTGPSIQDLCQTSYRRLPPVRTGQRVLYLQWQHTRRKRSRGANGRGEEDTNTSIASFALKVTKITRDDGPESQQQALSVW
ncbi:hypothetical protein R3P38DRAFT_2795998 [Favolaschia claudopus]|uniref:Uncharacterized protein n=1 Tax=Favolaschia claudopus TaxID=2862362 RepID=A0AAW0A738_9AGAR